MKPKKITKYYATRPKHQFWNNDGRLERIEPVGNGTNWNFLHQLRDGVKKAGIVVGYNLINAFPISEEEFENQFKA